MSGGNCRSDIPFQRHWDPGVITAIMLITVLLCKLINLPTSILVASATRCHIGMSVSVNVCSDSCSFPVFSICGTLHSVDQVRNNLNFPIIIKSSSHFLSDCPVVACNLLTSLSFACVFQYLNIKLTDISVTDPEKYPHMVGLARSLSSHPVFVLLQLLDPCSETGSFFAPSAKRAMTLDVHSL